MKWYTINFVLLFALIPGIALSQAVDWKKSAVQIENVTQRYTQAQVEEQLQKRLSSFKKNISQHETFDIRDSLEGVKDTIRGTGILIADAGGLYIVTAKHIIKTTRPYGNDHREVMNDYLTVHLDGSVKKTNNINLFDLISTSSANSPVVFSDDETDLAIISLQHRKNDVASYITQNGGVAFPIQNIMQNVTPGQQIITVGFTGLSGSNIAGVTSGSAKGTGDKDFIVEMAVYPGNSGGPVICNGKLAGVLSYPTGVTNNIAAADHPSEKASSAKAIKASLIIQLLKKLQENEKNPAFNRP